MSDDFVNDLAALEPLVWVTYGQGSFGYRCKFCESDDWGGPLTHKSSCVWRRAHDASPLALYRDDREGLNDGQ